MHSNPRNDNALREQGEVGTPNSSKQAALSFDVAATVKPFAPTYPSHDTQAARLLAATLQGDRINPLAGWQRLGIYRLSDTKFRLKELGWPMRNDGLPVSNRFGEQCHVALYGLEPWAIEAAGMPGQEFAQHEFEIMARKREAA